MKILVITPFGNKGWTWLSQYFPEHEWTVINNDLFGAKKPFWLLKALFSIKNAEQYDIVISHHPYMALNTAVALALTFKSKKTKHFVFSFNHGNGFFFKGLTLKIAKRVFKDTNGFVVYSKAERFLFNKKYDIDLNKLSFCHWAVNPPEIDNVPADYIVNARPYISCMGRNNRDFETFIEVMRKTPQLNAIIVCPKERITSDNIPENILIKNDIPIKEAMTVLANSAVSVVPIKDVSTGAGHMTIVAAMQLGIPQLLTKLETVDDYFLDQKHGFYIEVGDVESMSDNLNKIIGDEGLHETIRLEAESFSKKWLVEQSSVNFLKIYLEAIESNKSLPLFPG